jgi:acyl-CoA thioesterase-1
VSLARSRLNLANVLDDAQAAGVPVFVLGPPPALDADLDGRAGELATAFADVCRRRGVPFVDCYRPLVGHEHWFADLTAGDGVHPGQSGYGLLAWLVLHGGWHAWLGVPEDE